MKKTKMISVLLAGALCAAAICMPLSACDAPSGSTGQNQNEDPSINQGNQGSQGNQGNQGNQGSQGNQGNHGNPGGLPGTQDKEDNTIEILLLTNQRETEFYERYFAEMEGLLRTKGYNYEIHFTGEYQGDYYTSLTARFNIGEAPDIFYVRPDDIMYCKEYIAPVQDFVDGEGKEYGDFDGLYDTALDIFRYNAQTGDLGGHTDPLYAFPKDLSVQQLGYNKQELESHALRIKALKNSKGEAMKLPWEMDFSKENYTWDDYKLICEKIADNCENGHYACDVPPVEVLTRSFGGELIDLGGGRQNAKVSSLSEGAVHEAIKYQAELIDCGAAVDDFSDYINFTAGRMCFLSTIGSWEVADYDSYLGIGSWDIMPWPTEDGDTDWQGIINASGYAISKDCAQSEKGRIAMQLAASFMSAETQERLVRMEKFTLPLRKIVADSYREPENNVIYSPESRGVFLDVISGEHGAFPASYYTYSGAWLTALDDALDDLQRAGKGYALAQFRSTDWAAVLNEMQAAYDETKGI